MPMLAYYVTKNGRIETIEQMEKGCWIRLTQPTQEEIEQVTASLSLDPDFMKSALDDEETSHIDAEDDQTMVIIDIPYIDKDEKGSPIYVTYPLGIIVTPDNIVTVCLKKTSILDDIADNKVRGIETHWKTRFVFQIFLRVAVQFLQHLRQIDKISKFVERQLHKSMRNKELIRLLELEKSLVFFSTSLNSNEITFEKIRRGRLLKIYDDDQDLLEDVLIEIRQAKEMCNIYSSILSGTMDAFASVISNNLNIVMKTLTSVTILMTVPNIIFSFYGMNVANLPFDHFWWFPLGVAAVIAVVVGLFLRRKDLM